VAVPVVDEVHNLKRKLIYLTAAAYNLQRIFTLTTKEPA
jgi:hypothetical protein